MVNVINHRENENLNHSEFEPPRMAVIKKTDNNKSWGECGEIGTLIHYWWECNIVQSLWKTVRHFLKRLSIELPYNQAILFRGVYPREMKTYVHVKTCI